MFGSEISHSNSWQNFSKMEDTLSKLPTNIYQTLKNFFWDLERHKKIEHLRQDSRTQYPREDPASVDPKEDPITENP